MIRTHNWLKSASVAVLCLSVTLLLRDFVGAQDVVDIPPVASSDTLPAGEDGPEVLTHGPVHEAFANPLAMDLDEGLVVTKTPPDPIDELPPDYMPEGENVEWVPGYWALDEEVDDFIWISGLWRNVPPDQQWIPGYWAEVEGGYRWISGFWTDQESATLEYLPYPPATLEQGPNVAAPSENSFWIPGCWVYESADYQWQPGYWAPAHGDMCWVPRQYIWTPRGALCSMGYWDFRIPHRGLLFAPVRFHDHGHYYRGGNRFTPGYVVDPGSLLVSLFVRPRYNHYYFGNYYGDQYRNRGFRPWFDPGNDGRYHYDPLLTFYKSYYGRRSIDFSGRMHGWYDYYERHPNRRPSRTWAESVSSGHHAGRNGDSNRQAGQLTVAHALTDLVSGGNAARPEARVDHPWKFRQLAQDQRGEFSRSADDLRDFVKNRARVEDRREAAKPDRQDDRGLTDRIRSTRDRPLSTNTNADSPAQTPGSPERRRRRNNTASEEIVNGTGGDRRVRGRSVAEGESLQLPERRNRRRNDTNIGGSAIPPQQFGPARNRGDATVNAPARGEPGTPSNRIRMQRPDWSRPPAGPGANTIGGQPGAAGFNRRLGSPSIPGVQPPVSANPDRGNQTSLEQRRAGETGSQSNRNFFQARPGNFPQPNAVQPRRPQQDFGRIPQGPAGQGIRAIPGGVRGGLSGQPKFQAPPIQRRQTVPGGVRPPQQRPSFSNGGGGGNRGGGGGFKGGNRRGSGKNK